MSSSVLALLAAAALAPQNPSLRLPDPPPKPGTAVAVQRPLSEVERFNRHVSRLRASPVEVERTLQAIAQEFPDVEALILQRLGVALPHELLDLMIAARRFSSPRIADELQFQLLARPVGDATRDLLETLFALKGQNGPDAMRECVRGRIAGVRRTATEILARVARPEDLDFALQLVDDQLLDLRLSGVELLAALREPRAKQRLVQLLAKEPTLAGAACAALLRDVEGARAELEAVLAQPPIDRSFHYAAFVLAATDRDGTQLPPAAAVPSLQNALGSPDTLARSLAAVALGEMCYHGAADAADDATVVAALLDVVAAERFVPNFELLRRPAEHALHRLTGRTGTEAVGWRAWWADASRNFAGLRSRLSIEGDRAASAVLSLRDDRRHVRILGEAMADLPPVQGALEYVFEAPRLVELVSAMQMAGFMKPGAIEVPSGLALARSIELSVGDGRTQVAAPLQAVPAFEALVAIVDRATEPELWQLLRHPIDEPERGAFWRSEKRLRAAQNDPRENDRRSLQRAIRAWSVAAPVQRRMLLAWMLTLPRGGAWIREEDGRALIALVAAAPQFGDDEMVLLELAAGAPGDTVWRECVDQAARAGTRTRVAVDRVFAVLGADRLLQALGDERAEVRRAAIDQVVAVRDLRAQEQLVRMFDDPEPGVRRAAVFACGQLKLAVARAPLVQRIADQDTDPALRRDAMAALGRIGGEGVFSVLQRALASPVQADRDAALRGLGELRDERAADQLASIFTASLGQPSAELARVYLTRMGTHLAVPALRKQLETQNTEVRAEVVLMLGACQDPQVVPDLVDLLQRRRDTLLVSGMLAGTTGLDLDSVADPVFAVDEWWRAHRLEPQWRWLLQALERDKVKHSLEEAQFAPSAGLVALPELARIMVEAEHGRLRVLASAVLRAQAGEDLGTLTPSTPIEVRQNIAAKYRELYESARAAQGR